MALTRAQTDAELVRRCGGFMRAANFTYTDLTGHDTGLNAVLRWALRAMEVADTVSVVDSTLAAVADADLSCLMGLAELRLLENCMGNFDFVAPLDKWGAQKAEALAKRISEKIERLREELKVNCEYGLGELEVGKIELNFVEHNDD